MIPSSFSHMPELDVLQGNLFRWRKFHDVSGDPKDIALDSFLVVCVVLVLFAGESLRMLWRRNVHYLVSRSKFVSILFAIVDNKMLVLRGQRLQELHFFISSIKSLTALGCAVSALIVVVSIPLLSILKAYYGKLCLFYSFYCVAH